MGSLSYPLPNFSNGVAREAGESVYPHWWNELAGLWDPSATGPAASRIEDLSIYDNHMDMGGSMDPFSDWVSGEHGWAIGFDGVDDTTSVLDHESLDGMASLTVIAVFFVTAMPANNYIIVGKTDSGQESYMLRLSSLGQLKMAVRTTTKGWFSSGTTADSPVSSIQAGQWYCAIGTYTNGDYVRIYIDGKFQNIGSPAISGNIYSGTSLLRCGHTAAGVSPFNGMISQVAIYRRAFDGGEVVQYYSNIHAALEPELFPIAPLSSILGFIPASYYYGVSMQGANI